MLDAGFWELIIIGVIMLVVVGPERLPQVMRTIGLWVGRARHAFYSMRDEIEREVNTEKLRETEQALRRDVEETVNEARVDKDIAASTQADAQPEATREDAPVRELSEAQIEAGEGQETDLQHAVRERRQAEARADEHGNHRGDPMEPAVAERVAREQKSRDEQ